jgi:hypothetical protein
MGDNEFTKEEIIQLSKAYSDGITERMNLCMSLLPKQKKSIVYIPDNQDNTYIVKTVSSLEKAYPKPISPECVQLLDFKSMTETLIKFVEQESKTFSLDKIPEACFDYYNRTGDFDKFCIEVKRIGGHKVTQKSDALAMEECDRLTKILSEIAKKMGLIPQEEFYISKFKEYLENNPEVSGIYSKLSADHKINYVKLCYEELNWKMSMPHTRITSNQAFKTMTEKPEVFTAIDITYGQKYRNDIIEDFELTESEEEEERD